MTQSRALAREQHKIFDAAAMAGVPESQRAPGLLALQIVPQIAQEATPIKHTVRRLTIIERLRAAGVLEPHEAAACQWYADAHTLGFDTIGCTANYDGRGGGGIGPADLTARYKAQMDARADYALGRTHIPTGYVALFEAIVIRQETISDVAARAFDLKRSQAENKTRAALKFCANLLHTGIAPLLSIEAPAKPAEARPAKAAPAPAEATPAARYRPTTDALDLALDSATLKGVTVTAIQIAPFTAAALKREGGHEGSFRRVPLVERPGWAWGFVLGSGTPDPASEQAA